MYVRASRRPLVQDKPSYKVEKTERPIKMINISLNALFRIFADRDIEVKVTPKSPQDQTILIIQDAKQGENRLFYSLENCVIIDICKQKWNDIIRGESSDSEIRNADRVPDTSRKQCYSD
jgi:hypothetical protein